MFGALKRYGAKRWAVGEDAAAPGDMTFRDKALAALALLNKDYGTAYGIQQSAAKGAAAKAALQAQAEVPKILTGRAYTKGYNGVAGPTVDGSEPAATSIPFAERRVMLPNLRDTELLRRLFEAQAKGADITQAMEALKAGQADIAVGPGGEAYDRKNADVDGRVFRNPTVVNDTVIDLNNPKNEERQIPKVGEGQMLVKDMQGNFHVMPIPGFAEAAAGKAGQVAGAEAEARSRHETVTGVDSDGRPVTRRKSDITGATNGQPLVGPSEEQSTFNKKAGEAEAARYSEFKSAVDADERNAPLFKEMERLLDSGNLVTGFGADVRLNAERAMALAGDEGAKARVAATESWQNLTNRQVLPLIKALGASSAISDADREFTQKIVAGDIKLNEATMREVVRIGREAAQENRRRLEAYGRPGVSPGAQRRSGPTTSGKGFRILSVE